MTDHLVGRTAIVTGAGRGVFRAVAEQLARAGAAVVVVDSGVGVHGEGGDESVAESVAAGIRALGARAIACTESVSTYAGAEAIRDSALSAFGRVDVLVNGAGTIRQNMLWDMPENDFDAVIAVHLKGTWNCLRVVAPLMIEQGSGSVVNVASGVGLFGRLASSNYAAAKGGIIGMTRACALDLGPLGLRVNAVCPIGFSRMIEFPEPWRERYVTEPNRLPSPESYPPDAVAPLVVYLATDAAADINGQVFDSGGGRVSWHARPAYEGTSFLQAREGVLFGVDELAERVPVELLHAYTNPAPRQDGPDRVWPN